MINKKDLTLKKILITVAVFLVLSAAVAWLWYTNLSSTNMEYGEVLSREQMIFNSILNGISVVSILMVAVAGLVWVYAKGTFNGIGYGLSVAITRIIPPVFSKRKRDAYYSQNGKPETYAEYCERKALEDEPSFWHILFVGLGGLVISIILTVIYCNIY